jgi:ATP synthase protein I
VKSYDSRLLAARQQKRAGRFNVAMANDAERDERDRTTADSAWMIVSHLLAGIILYGGIGWLLGLWLGHQGAFVAAGVILGSALSMYLVHVRVSQLDGDIPTKHKRR